MRNRKEKAARETSLLDCRDFFTGGNRWSVTELADVAGIALTTLTRMRLRGLARRRMPSASQCAKLAQFAFEGLSAYDVACVAAEVYLSRIRKDLSNAHRPTADDDRTGDEVAQSVLEHVAAARRASGSSRIRVRVEDR